VQPNKLGLHQATSRWFIPIHESAVTSTKARFIHEEHLFRTQERKRWCELLLIISQAPSWDLQQTQILICKPILIALALPNWHPEQNWADQIMNKPCQLSTRQNKTRHRHHILQKAQVFVICLANDATSNRTDTTSRKASSLWGTNGSIILLSTAKYRTWIPNTWVEAPEIMWKKWTDKPLLRVWVREISCPNVTHSSNWRRNTRNDEQIPLSRVM